METMVYGLQPAMYSLANHQPIFRNQPLIQNNTTRAVKKKEGGLTEYSVYARGLSIAWGDDSRHWRWVPLEDDEEVEVAELISVNWLEVRGKTKMNLLEPCVKYEAFFVVKMKNVSDFSPEVTLTLEPPNKKIQTRKVDLNMIPQNVWIRVKIGEFETGEVDQNSGEVKYSLINVDPPLKEGLMVEGVLFLPIY